MTRVQGVGAVVAALVAAAAVAAVAAAGHPDDGGTPRRWCPDSPLMGNVSTNTTEDDHGEDLP